jgi:hypothetical protein
MDPPPKAPEARGQPERDARADVVGGVRWMQTIAEERSRGRELPPARVGEIAKRPRRIGLQVAALGIAVAVCIVVAVVLSL